MSLDATAIDKIIGLAPIERFEIHGRTYASESLTPIKEPMVSPVEVHTLTGLVDLLSDKAITFLDPKQAYMIHVNTHRQVNVLTQDVNDWSERACWIKGTCLDTEAFPFERYFPPDEFIVKFQTQFVPTEESANLLRLVSNLASEAVAISADDGIAQRATVQTSVVSKGTVEVRPRWTLQPFRTFLEIEQPRSEFLFRLKSTNGQPHCALFEADGGRWKLDAVLAIKTWLESNLDSEKFPVIA